MYDAAREQIYVAYTLWQSQFGEDAPEVYLTAIDREGEELWNTWVWSYSPDGGHSPGGLQPVLFGDEVAVNTASPFGAFEGPVEQIRGFTSSTGEMAWSVESHFTHPMVANAESLFVHNYGLVLNLAVGADAMGLLYIDSSNRQQRSGTPLSMPLAINRDGSVLYAANRAFHIDIQPANDWIVAIDTGTDDPESALWETELPHDRILSDGPVLSEELVVLPLANGIWALDRERGASRWVVDMEHPIGSAVVGDGGAIYFLEWGDEQAWVGAVDMDGSPQFRCLLPVEGPFYDSNGIDTTHRTTLILHDGRLMIPLGSKIVTLQVNSNSLAATGWPRRYGNNRNTSAVP
ncbi:MAG: hypothetical protein AAFS10_24620 [Myxococcota bacterium]